ncbi:hypothetical protein [Hydrogenophaga sp.]|uniref:hypothetical protein n=1 Tax=Hydrogenophaga sp. TaxID=1904254 RepID=UPI0025C7303F|nr:hypothetical protein [Hydrogenophaga sp.]
MRAFLVLLMLTLLPLQFSAAAVVACCGHVEAVQGPKATHHRTDHGVVDGDSVTDSGSFDLDCGTCHSNCAAALTTTTATQAEPVGIEPAAQLAERLLPPWHARPYRPQWLAPNGSGWNAFT